MEENTGSASENGIGSFDDLVRWVESVVYMLIPKAENTFSVTGDQDRKRLALTVTFTDDRFVGLFFGYAMSNLKALMQLIRSQQMYPHDRYIQIAVVRSDGTSQTFLNKDVSKYRKEDERKGTKDGGTEEQVQAFVRKRSEQRQLIRLQERTEEG